MTQDRDEIARMREENARLREKIEALQTSAEMWIYLYERQLARANRLANESARLRARPTVAPGTPGPIIRQRPSRMWQAAGYY